MEEGYEALSVRKIAGRIEYSTGVIYHYFLDKEEIVRAVAEEGYGRILKEINRVVFDPDQPVEGIKNFFLEYYRAMLENRSYAKLALLSDIEGILQKAVILEKGISQRSTSMGILTARLEGAMARGLIKVKDPELTAQLLWTTFYGLLARLILEKNTPPEQQKRLMDELFLLVDSYLLP